MVAATAACGSQSRCYMPVSKQVPVGTTARLTEVPRNSSGQLDFDGWYWNLPPEIVAASDASASTVRLREGPLLDVMLPGGQVEEATLIGCK